MRTLISILFMICMFIISTSNANPRTQKHKKNKQRTKCHSSQGDAKRKAINALQYK